MPSFCPICHHEFELPNKPLARHLDNSVDYNLWACPACLVQFWLPFKNPGATWYENDDRYAGANNKPSIESTVYHRRTISFLKPLVGRVLDVGCGTGNFLNLARRAGWQTAGIDFDRNAVNTARTFFQLPDINEAGLAEYSASGPGKFNLITFFDLIEHIDNHQHFFELVRHLLYPQGYIAMSLPCRGGASFLQPHDLPPRHLSRWNSESLVLFLEKQGFTTLEVKEERASWWFIVMKLRFRYGRLVSFGLVRHFKTSGFVSIGTEGLPVSPKIKSSINKSIWVHSLAKIKDGVIFGIPAFLVWIYLHFTNQDKITLFAIARSKA